MVYNIPGWTRGYSTAIELYGDYQSAVAYVCKYIGKERCKIGGRWYYGGGDLRKAQVEYQNSDYGVVSHLWDTGTQIDVPAAGLTFWQWDE